MKKAVLIQMDQKEFEAVVFRCVLQALKLNSNVVPEKSIKALPVREKTKARNEEAVHG